jgi:2-hydroxy-6-oxonona-2,4-dienedioate hydrolase
MTAIPGAQDRFVDVDGGRVHYVEVGSGHPIVLLHGSGPGATGVTNYHPNIESLAQHFRVLAVDMPGWGQSYTPPEETGADHPKTLVSLLDVLGIERAALVGNSMGGMTSITVAITHPERVSHLVTMGAPTPTASLLFSAGGWSEGMQVLLRAYREPTPDNMRSLVQVMCFDQKWATEELAEARSRAALVTPAHLDSWNRQFDGPPRPNPFFALGDRVREVSAPTLVIHGRDDRVVHYENGLQLTTRIADSRMVLLNRCGHWAQIEHADEFNRLVSNFVLT